MRIVVCTGLFPPDIGGPATHAADLTAELRARGHGVTVLTLGRGDEGAEPGVVRHRRSTPWPVRAVAGIWWLVRHRRSYDLVYATGQHLVAVPGARLAGRPVVLKIVGDVAWERGRERGLVDCSFEDFQALRMLPARLRAVRWSRNWCARRASAVVTPGHALARWAQTWAPGQDVTVVPNGVAHPHPHPHPPQTCAGIVGETPTIPAQVSRGGGPALVFAGRLVPHKRVDVLLEAVAEVDGARLTVIGDGPQRRALEDRAAALGLGDRVSFAGEVGHDQVLEALAAAHALVLPSSYEGLSHVTIESLVVGTPVVVAGAPGHLEVVVDGHNGLVVEPMTASALAAALVRLRDEPGLQEALAEGARTSGRQWDFGRCADALVELFERAATGRPRVVFFGKSRVPEPVPARTEAKFALHARLLDQVVVGTGPAGRRPIAGVEVVCFPALRPAALGSAAFYTAGAVVAVARAARRRPSAVVCQSPFEAVGVMAVRALVPRRWRPLVQVEVHSDWRVATRLYGSRARRLAGPVADRACRWALVRADQVRAVSLWTEQLARDAGYRGPVVRYLAHGDYADLVATPAAALPASPRALFLGALESPKALDVLLDAWAEARADLPTSARLAIAGGGRLRGWLDHRVARDDVAGTVEVLGPVPPSEIGALLDQSTCLVLPSRSEAMGRVLVEAMCRGRAVVATAVGGVPETVRDRGTGLLVPPERPDALAAALVEVLTDAGLAAGLGQAGRAWAEAEAPADRYAAGIADLARWVAGGGQVDLEQEPAR
ncbi:MAG: glycosyltransferase family 4 protein [Actinomycetota bacterium]